MTICQQRCEKIKLPRASLLVAVKLSAHRGGKMALSLFTLYEYMMFYIRGKIE